MFWWWAACVDAGRTRCEPAYTPVSLDAVGPGGTSARQDVDEVAGTFASVLEYVDHHQSPLTLVLTPVDAQEASGCGDPWLVIRLDAQVATADGVFAERFANEVIAEGILAELALTGIVAGAEVRGTYGSADLDRLEFAVRSAAVDHEASGEVYAVGVDGGRTGIGSWGGPLRVRR